MEQGRKNVLMICPGFFGYREAIAREIENLGFSVDVYDERLEGGFWAKAMIRLNCRLYYPVIEKYYGRIVAENRHKDYAYIFVVKGEAITPRVMQQLRQTWPRAEFVLYLWDSVKNVPQGQTRLGWYDRVLTFDPEDAKAYGLQFRPLFFSREFSGIPSGGENTYAVAFIGTAHSIRPRVIHQLTQQCQSLGKKIFAYQYCPYPAVYWKGVLTNRNFRYLKPSQVHYTPLSKEEIREIYSKSSCVLDVEHVQQTGLTMRTIELVGMGKKIITTNFRVREYDFYDPNNIYILDKDEPWLDPAFLEAQYRPIPGEIRQRYSIEAFVRDIFNVRERYEN